MKKLLLLLPLSLFLAACEYDEPDAHYCERVNAYKATKHTGSPVGHRDYLNKCQ